MIDNNNLLTKTLANIRDNVNFFTFHLIFYQESKQTRMTTNQVESLSVPSSASIHEKNAIKAFASVWQIKTGETAFFQSEEVIFSSSWL